MRRALLLVLLLILGCGDDVDQESVHGRVTERFTCFDGAFVATHYTDGKTIIECEADVLGKLRSATNTTGNGCVISAQDGDRKASVVFGYSSSMGQAFRNTVDDGKVSTQNSMCAHYVAEADGGGGDIWL